MMRPSGLWLPTAFHDAIESVEPTTWQRRAIAIGRSFVGPSCSNILPGRLRRESNRSYLQAHSIELPPHCDAVVIGVTEGYVKFRRQMNNIRQQQPNARGREISHRTADKGILLEQDHTRLGTPVPRGQSPFNASIHLVPRYGVAVPASNRQIVAARSTESKYQGGPPLSLDHA